MQSCQKVTCDNKRLKFDKGVNVTLKKYKN